MEANGTSDVYVLTVTFGSGARASLRTHEHPSIPDTIWEPGSLCWLGDDHGHQIEITGGEVVSLNVQRQRDVVEIQA